MAQMDGGKIPSIMNHLESGQFSVESGNTTYNIQLTEIVMPKGIIIYSNAFDIDSAQADKPLLGAYGAYYIGGTDTLPLQDNGYYLNRYSFYFTNWGQNTGSKNPTARSSRTETRGIRFFNPSDKTINVVGFGTGDYDFKSEVIYNWLAWD